MPDDLATMDATAQAELVRSGEASPVELVDAAIDRVEALNGELNAVIHPLFDKAREAAEAGSSEGPFRGVPMVVKDLGPHTAGDPFHEGMGFLKAIGWTEEEDTELIRRYRRAGFVIVGKTNTPELGILPTTEPEAYGPSRNPWDTDRSTGGSSGGSAAAVASGMVPVGHANDGGGSIRIPASSCGLVGLKPSRGRITLAPEFGDIYAGLVNDHVVCRSVRDCAAILDATAGPAPGDPYTAPEPARPYAQEVGADPGRLRIGLRTDPPGRQFEAHPDVVAAAESAARLLESLGHAVEESAPTGVDDPRYIETFILRWTAGIAWVLGYWERKTGRQIGADDVEACTWALAEAGRGHSAPDLLAALEYHQAAARGFAQWHEDGWDLLLTPTMGEPPTRIGEYATNPDDPTFPLQRAVPLGTFTAGFNASGQPAISLPLHQSDEGLPIGVHLVAPYGREDLLLRVAAQLEEAQPWAGRTPPTFAGRATA